MPDKPLVIREHSMVAIDGNKKASSSNNIKFSAENGIFSYLAKTEGGLNTLQERNRLPDIIRDRSMKSSFITQFNSKNLNWRYTIASFNRPGVIFSKMEENNEEFFKQIYFDVYGENYDASSYSSQIRIEDLKQSIKKIISSEEINLFIEPQADSRISRVILNYQFSEKRWAPMFYEGERIYITLDKGEGSIIYGSIINPSSVILKKESDLTTEDMEFIKKYKNTQISYAHLESGENVFWLKGSLDQTPPHTIGSDGKKKYLIQDGYKTPTGDIFDDLVLAKGFQCFETITNVEFSGSPKVGTFSMEPRTGISFDSIEDIMLQYYKLLDSEWEKLLLPSMASEGVQADIWLRSDMKEPTEKLQSVGEMNEDGTPLAFYEPYSDTNKRFGNTFYKSNRDDPNSPYEYKLLDAQTIIQIYTNGRGEYAYKIDQRQGKDPIYIIALPDGVSVFLKDGKIYLSYGTNHFVYSSEIFPNSGSEIISSTASKVITGSLISYMHNFIYSKPPKSLRYYLPRNTYKELVHIKDITKAFSSNKIPLTKKVLNKLYSGDINLQLLSELTPDIIKLRESINDIPLLLNIINFYSLTPDNNFDLSFSDEFIKLLNNDKTLNDIQLYISEYNKYNPGDVIDLTLLDLSKNNYIGKDVYKGRLISLAESFKLTINQDLVAISKELINIIGPYIYLMFLTDFIAIDKNGHFYFKSINTAKNLEEHMENLGVHYRITDNLRLFIHFFTTNYIFIDNIKITINNDFTLLSDYFNNWYDSFRTEISSRITEPHLLNIALNKFIDKIDPLINYFIEKAIDEANVKEDHKYMAFWQLKNKFFLPLFIRESTRSYLPRILDKIWASDTMHKIQSRALDNNFNLLDEKFDLKVKSAKYKIHLNFELSQQQKEEYLYSQDIPGKKYKRYYSEIYLNDKSHRYEDVQVLNNLGTIQNAIYSRLKEFSSQSIYFEIREINGKRRDPRPYFSESYRIDLHYETYNEFIGDPENKRHLDRLSAAIIMGRSVRFSFSDNKFYKTDPESIGEVSCHGVNVFKPEHSLFGFSISKLLNDIYSSISLTRPVFSASFFNIPVSNVESFIELYNKLGSLDYKQRILARIKMLKKIDYKVLNSKFRSSDKMWEMFYSKFILHNRIIDSPEATKAFLIAVLNPDDSIKSEFSDDALINSHFVGEVS